MEPDARMVGTASVVLVGWRNRRWSRARSPLARRGGCQRSEAEQSPFVHSRLAERSWRGAIRDFRRVRQRVVSLISPTAVMYRTMARPVAGQKPMRGTPTIIAVT